MITSEKKLNALMRFSALVQQQPGMVLLAGYLAGQVNRIHFVQNSEGAPVIIRLAARRFPLISKPPYMAHVNGVSIPDPVSLIHVLHENQDPVAVQLDLDPAEAEEWYQDVVVSNIYAASREENDTKQEVQNLQKEIDQALDIYNECRKVLESFDEETSDPEQKKRLQLFLRMAQEDIRRLSQRMAELNQIIEGQSGN